MATTWVRRGIMVVSGVVVIVLSLIQSATVGLAMLLVFAAMIALILLVRFGASWWPDETAAIHDRPSPE